MNKKILVALACASTMASAAATDLIDDFEDGNGVANTDKGTYTDVWFAYTDVNDKGASSYTNEKDADGDVVVFAEAAADGSKFGAGLKGIVLNKGENEWDPYVALGLKVAGGLSGCTELTYDYMGAAHNLKATVKGDEKGALSGYNKPKAAVDGSTTWAKASIPVSTLKQEDWGKDTKKVNLVMANVVQLDWEVKKEATSDFLYIDNFVCTGYKPGSSSNSGSGTTSSTVSIIDDFEDGNTAIDSLGKNVYWYIYTDKAEVGNTQDENETWDLIDSTDGQHYAVMKGITGITSGDETYPSVGMGFDVPASALASCTGISYKYKGSGHVFRALVDGVTDKAGKDHVSPQQPAASDWKTVTISTADMNQPDWVTDPTSDAYVAKDVKAFSWKGVLKAAWVVDEKLTDANIGSDLAIDDVACLGTLAKTTTPKQSIAQKAKVSGLNASINGFNLDVTVAKSSMVKVHVFDMQGQVAKTFSENVAGSRSFDLRGLAKGSYLVRVSSGSMVKTARIAIK